MLKYLIIILDATAPSFCYCDNAKTERKPMPLDVLKKSVLFAMKENLSVQFVCPDYELPSQSMR